MTVEIKKKNTNLQYRKYFVDPLMSGVHKMVEKFSRFCGKIFYICLAIFWIPFYMCLAILWIHLCLAILWIHLCLTIFLPVFPFEPPENIMKTFSECSKGNFVKKRVKACKRPLFHFLSYFQKALKNIRTSFLSCKNFEQLNFKELMCQ